MTAPLKLRLLNDQREVVEVDVITWLLNFNDSPRNVVAQTQVNKGTWVSSVFIGCPPADFETAIFIEGECKYRFHSSTWAKCEEVHGLACSLCGAVTMP